MKLNLKRIAKKITKLNFVTVFFFVLSIVSMSFAWFAFSNEVNNNLEIEVKSWNVSINDGGQEVGRNIIIDINDFYPGSSSYNNSLTITNSGDLNAKIEFEITYLRIFNDVIDVTNQSSLLTNLSQNYPFYFDFSLDTKMLESGQSSTFDIMVDWPLDSGNDALDSTWGNNAYLFNQTENAAHNADNSYVKRKAIEMNINVNVTQLLDSETNVSDNNFRLGESFLVDTSTMQPCQTVGGNCHTFYVIDYDNLLSDTTVSLIGSTSETFTTISGVTATDFSTLLKAISSDIYSTLLYGSTISDRVLGNNLNSTSITNIITRLRNENLSIKFSKNKFPFLASSNCYWTNTIYDSSNTFAVTSLNNNAMSIRSLSNVSSCIYVPIISINKSLLSD